MTDHEDPSLDADFDDPAYDELRGLLAAARLDAPIPAEVAARLDDTLAELTADRRPAAGLRAVETADPETGPEADPETNPETNPVAVPLRRRSRLAPRLLVAAAAVVLVGAGGVGVNQVLKNSADSGSPAAGTAAKDAPRVTADAPEVAPQQTPEPASGNGALLDGVTSSKADAAGFNFSSARFETQVDAFFGSTDVAGRAPDQDRGDNAPSNGGSAAEEQPMPAPTNPTPRARTSDGLSMLNKELNGYSATVCPGPADPGGDVLPIRLDGKPAALVVGPLVDGSRLVRAWSCDGTAVLASASIDR
ncbi:hypothetical protein EFK50_20770 [Nocardioides marmoriginsengisoli]|uniref:Uncharacterized protein n=1 Tax=Nocardioides marmoriginsengisoli TaxID=661483 RepID=A0A3N0CBQ1_9ACTN|nr:hypothetical protein [Nocardioides marmoriginsengisoli]RNL60739.1 hypothetical protein EFK50_20770 [Nocardioides marmoriginsengisoli]